MFRLLPLTLPLSLVLFLPSALPADPTEPTAQSPESMTTTVSARAKACVTTDSWSIWFDKAPLTNAPLVAYVDVVKVLPADKTLEIETVKRSEAGTEWLQIRDKSDKALWIPLVYCRNVAAGNVADGNLPIGQERVGRYHGLPPGYRPSDMVRLPQAYCYNDLPQRLRKEAAGACKKLIDTARKDAKLHIKVLSAYRSAYTQSYLCREKIKADGFQQSQVARPGHSEHQLGTTVDFVGVKGVGLLNEEFGQTPEGRWLEKNARRFGFIQTYTRAGAARIGIQYEPWHFRYVGKKNLGRFVTETASAESE